LELLSYNIGFFVRLFERRFIFAMLFIYNTTTAENSMNMMYEGQVSDKQGMSRVK